MCVCMYVCLCVCVRRVCVCVCEHMPFHVTPLSHTHVHVCIYSCYVHQYINTQMHANIHLYLPLISKHTSTKEHAVAHRIQGLRFESQEWGLRYMHIPVNRATPLPMGFRLTSAIAWSSELTNMQHSTGPKISSLSCSVLQLLTCVAVGWYLEFANMQRSNACKISSFLGVSGWFCTIHNNHICVRVCVWVCLWVYVTVCMCVCVCMWETGKEKNKESICLYLYK